jgi:hypothetical protein
MIVVYKGKTQSINIRGEQFDYNTPTYIKPALREVIGEREDFELYNKNKDYTYGEKRFIYINLPSDIELLVNSFALLERCREYYPLNPIKVRCDNHNRILLPPVNETEDYTKPRDRQYNYREYDCHISKKELISALFTTPFSFSQLILVRNKLFESLKDKELKPLKSTEKYDEKNILVIVKSGDSINKTISDIYENLNLKSLNCEIVEIEAYEPKEMIQTFELFKKAKYILFCGDSKLAALAGYMNKKGFVFIDDSEYNRSLHFRGVIGGTTIQSYKYNKPKIIEAIDKQLKEAFSSANRVPVRRFKKEEDTDTPKEETKEHTEQMDMEYTVEKKTPKKRKTKKEIKSDDNGNKDT